EVAQSRRLGVAVRGGDHVHVASGGGDNRVARVDGAADVVQVGARAQRHGVAGDAPVQVVQILPTQLHRRAAGDGARVDQVTLQAHVDDVGADQRAIAVEVVWAHAYVHLRHQRGGGGAV